jgi:archaeal preflagellin peptidase FlaK
MIELYYLSVLVLLSTLIYVSFLDLRDRRVPFKYWYPIIIVGTLSTLTFIILNYTLFSKMTIIILLTTVIVFWCCGYFGLMGGADAWAMIFISIFSISIPFNSILNNNSTGIGVSTYVNALIVSCIFYILYNLIINSYNSVKAPLYYMMFTQRINGSEITKKYCYILPDAISFFRFTEFFTICKDTKNLVYTRMFITHPELYSKEITKYNSYKYLYVINAIPFIVFITIGFTIAIIYGEII